MDWKKRTQLELVVLLIFFLWLFTLLGQNIYSHWPDPDRRSKQRLITKTLYANLAFSAVYEKGYHSIEEPFSRYPVYAICRLDSFEYLGDDAVLPSKKVDKYFSSMYYFQKNSLRFNISNAGLRYNDSIIAIKAVGDIRFLNKKARIYTTLGDSVIHFEMWNGKKGEYLGAFEGL